MSGLTHRAAPVIVTLPAEIDVANAETVRGQLVGAAVPGIAVVIADLTDTTFCDCHGFRELFAARTELATAGVDLRLALPQGHVWRVMRLLSLDQFVTAYPSVSAAIAGAASLPAVAPPR